MVFRYIEDFFLLGELTKQEKSDLKEAVFVSYLPTKNEFQKHIEDAGFVDVQVLIFLYLETIAYQPRKERGRGGERGGREGPGPSQASFMTL